MLNVYGEQVNIVTYFKMELITKKYKLLIIYNLSFYNTDLLCEKKNRKQIKVFNNALRMATY